MNINSRTIIALVVGSLAAGGITGYAYAVQVHMQAALDALQTARAELLAADNNKGGHRVKALDYVNAAIDETREGIQAGRD